MLKNILSKMYYDLPASIPCFGYAFPCRNVVFEITYDCNLNCEMCSFKNEINHTESSGSDLEVLKEDEIIRLLSKFPKGSNVTFTGGEPFMKKGMINILEAATKRHNVSLATNGTFLNEDIVRRLVEWKVMSVGISLDGPKDIHNEIRRDPTAYDKVISAVKLINEEKERSESTTPALALNSVILEKNFKVLYKNVELTKELGLTSCTFQICDASWKRSGWRLSEEINIDERVIEQVDPIDPIELRGALKQALDTADNLGIHLAFMPLLTMDEVISYYSKEFDLSSWQCLNPWSTMRISPYGDVFPCLNFKIGNVSKNDPEILWNSPKYRKFRKKFTKKAISDSCVGCCKMIRKHRRNGNENIGN